MEMPHKWRIFHICCIVLFFLVLALFHYHELIVGIPIVDKVWNTFPLGLSRHVIERFTFPLLVAYAGWMLGVKSGVAIWLASALAMLPQALFVSSNPRDALVESFAALIIGGLSILLTQIYRRSQRQQEALSSSQRSYEDLFTNASDAIWVHDLGGNIIIANKASEKITGYPPSELVGMNVSRFLFPEALLLAKEVRSRLVEGEAIDQRYEQHISKEDKTRSIVELATRLIKVEGKPTAFQHIARDVTEERKLRDRLRIQIQKNLMAQEEERKRIARELHDDIAQSILLASRRIDILMSGAGCKLPKPVTDELERLYGLVNEVYESLQRYARDLRPSILDQMGLVPALNWLTEELSNEMGIKVEVKADILPPLSSETELVMFRITQEALSNVRKYAEASYVSITVELGAGNIRMIIEDNGKGFSISKLSGDLAREGKLGVLGMQERAHLIGGNLEMKSELGRGTTIIVEAPV